MENDKLLDLQEILQKLSRGVGLEEFVKLSSQLEHAREEEEHWGWIYRALAFLDEVGALKHPRPTHNEPVAVKSGWVNVHGWIRSFEDPYKAIEYDVDYEWILGSLALKTRLLLMDRITHDFFSLFYSLSKQESIGIILGQALVASASFKSGKFPGINSIKNANGNLGSMVSDSLTRLTYDLDKVMGLVNESWVIASSKVDYDNSRFYYLTIPSWMRVISNIEDWTLFR